MNEEQPSFICCYFCVNESECKICRNLYHPLEAEYCFGKKCRKQRIIHSPYVKPSECENRSCLFYKLRVAAEKNRPSNRKLNFENGECTQS